MYGVIGKINCVPNQRDPFVALLLEASHAMPGCLSYAIAADPADADALWVTESGTVRPITRPRSPCLRSKQRSRKAAR
jgi:hypothetical protein